MVPSRTEPFAKLFFLQDCEIHLTFAASIIETTGELDYVERQMQIEDLLCSAEAEAIEQKMQMEDLLCTAEAEEVERQIQMEDLLTQAGYGWR